MKEGRRVAVAVSMVRLGQSYSQFVWPLAESVRLPCSVSLKWGGKFREPAGQLVSLNCDVRGQVFCHIHDGSHVGENCITVLKCKPGTTEGDRVCLGDSIRDRRANSITCSGRVIKN